MKRPKYESQIYLREVEEYPLRRMLSCCPHGFSPQLDDVRVAEVGGHEHEQHPTQFSLRHWCSSQSLSTVDFSIRRCGRAVRRPLRRRGRARVERPLHVAPPRMGDPRRWWRRSRMERHHVKKKNVVRVELRLEDGATGAASPQSLGLTSRVRHGEELADAHVSNTAEGEAHACGVDLSDCDGGSTSSHQRQMAVSKQPVGRKRGRLEQTMERSIGGFPGGASVTEPIGDEDCQQLGGLSPTECVSTNMLVVARAREAGDLDARPEVMPRQGALHRVRRSVRAAHGST